MCQLLYWNQLAAGEKDGREGRREGDVGAMILPRDGRTDPAPADAAVQLEVLLPASVNQWLRYCQAPGSLIYVA